MRIIIVPKRKRTAGGKRNFHKDGCHDFYSSRKDEVGGHVTEERYEHRIFVGKSEGKRQF
jgi:hypothetical protein